MGLAEDLKILKELRDKGELSESAYAAARDAAIGKNAPPSGSVRLGRFIGLRLIPFLALLLLIGLYVWYRNGSRATTTAIATVVHAPITVADEVENVPAHSWKAVALTISYGGSVDIDLQILRGNPMDVFLTTPDQLDAVKKEDWQNVRAFSGFNATKTESYKRTGQLSEGNYYLILRDTSLGILSSSATDISLKVRLNP